MFKEFFNRLSFKRFQKNEDGNIFITTGLLAPLLVLVVGIGVDTAEIYRARVNFQNAVDASALVVTKIIAAEGGLDTAQAKAKLAGKNVFHANMRNLNPGKGKANIDFIISDQGCQGGGISAVATLDHRVFFDFFHKVSEGTDIPDHVRLHGETEVECSNTTMEIALVLDNSGSMGGDKMTALKTATKNLVKTLHKSMKNSPGDDPLQFALIPFNDAVNVGADNNDQDWIDRLGLNPLHFENFSPELDPGLYHDGYVWRETATDYLMTRFRMYQVIRKKWAGCVEAREFPLNTTALSEPSASEPETLFMPMFAPDEPDRWGVSNSDEAFKRNVVRSTTAEKNICVSFNLTNKWGTPVPEVNRLCTQWSDGLRKAFRHPDDMYYLPTHNDGIEYSNGEYIGGSPENNPVGKWIENEYVSEQLFANSYMADDWSFPMTLRDHPRAVHNMGFDYGTDTGGQMNRQKWTWKYTKQGRSWPQIDDTTKWVGQTRGPNFGCEIQKITPLTASETTILRELEAMEAFGSTNVAHGAIWGWRTLSPVEPFADGRAYSETNNKKILIILSDGNNTHNSRLGNGSTYSVYGYAKKGRIFGGTSFSGSQFTQAMDSHLAATCKNAKSAGVSVYSIAFSVADGSSVKNLLEQCASVSSDGDRQYYDAEDTAQLSKYFAEIALTLSDLKITR